MRIKSIKNTGSCCPSQWEGITDMNESIYIRYRWGYLSIQLSKPNGTIKDAINEGKMVYSKQIGEEWDGMISLAEVSKIIKRERLI